MQTDPKLNSKPYDYQYKFKLFDRVCQLIKVTVIYNCTGAVKDIYGRIPENIQLYYFGAEPCSDTKASSLIKGLERSSLKPPAVDYTKSIYGKV